MKAIIWTKNGCGYCNLAKSLLRENYAEIEERNIQQDWTKAQLLYVLPDVKTVPQIFIDGKYVGGYEELKKYLYRRKLPWQMRDTQ